MQSLTQPILLLKPFAESGDKNSIPTTNTDTSNPQRADLTNGFPAVTSLSPDDGGLPPERKDFNGLGYLTTTYDYFYQAGGTFTYNATIASAIGGYPLGARLWYTDGNGATVILRSNKANNSDNFITTPSYIGTSWVQETPALSWNNTWTGSNTFSGNITSSGTNTFSGANTFTGNITSSGTNTWSGGNTFSGGITSSANNTWTGKNTFTGQNQRPITIECPWTLGTPPASTTYRQIQFTDENGTATGGIEKAYYDNGSFRTQIVCLKQDGSSNYARIGVGWDENGNEYITASNGVRSGIANMSMPNYSAGASKSSGTDYTATSNGFLYVEIHRSSSKSGTLDLKIGNTTLNIHSQDYDWNSCLFPIAKGVTYSLTLSGVALQKAVFYPCYGG